MALALSSPELDYHFAALGEIREAIDQAIARGAPVQEVAALIKQYGP
jgi:hypothetical protein